MTETLTTILQKRVLRPTPDEFRASRGLANAASWAIWGDRVDDLNVFKDHRKPWEHLRKDVVLFGGNFGELSEGAQSVETFKNFHYRDPKTDRPSIGDSKLRKSIAQTPLAGAFMSDLIKHSPTPYSGDLLRLLKKGEVDIQQCFIKPLKAEIKAVGIPHDAVFVLFGEGTLKVWEHIYDEHREDLDFLAGVTLAVTYRHFTAPGHGRKQISGNFADHINHMLGISWPRGGADPRPTRALFDSIKETEKARQDAALAASESSEATEQ